MLSACYFLCMSFADPKENILQLGLREGMRVGDFGAGSGHYTLAASGIVGGEGKVYAIDVQEDVLRRLRDAARHAGRVNIETIWGDVETKGGTKLRDGTLDAVIVSNVLFQANDRNALVLEAKRVLKGGGKLLLVDWAGPYGGLGPPAGRVVPEHAAEELLITAGFHKVKSFRAGPHHYGIVFMSP